MSGPRPDERDATPGGELDAGEHLGSFFAAFNELARTEGDVLAWVREWLGPRAEYRPIEDRDWFQDPEAIAKSIGRWMETWGVGTHRIEPEEIAEFGEGRFLVTARNTGVGRLSGVPIEATTYMAMHWSGDRLVWFDEYLDREAAHAALGGQLSSGAPHAQGATVAERVWGLGGKAFAAFVRRRSDDQLRRLFSSRRAQRAVFKRMERLFVSTKARGFVGEIQFELLESGEVTAWVIRIDRQRAVARAGEGAAPATTLRAGLPVFVRIAARELHPVAAYREGLLEVGGDFDVATRVEAMFGLSAK